jgi:anti-sigma regulatory factor (Ser/Thr protein kinase)
MWPGRTAAQAREVITHEALCNLAFAQTPVTFLCPYDAAALSAEVLADARRVHPHLWTAAGPAPCSDYDIDDLLMGQHPPALPDPHAEPLAVVTEVSGLAELRRSVRAIAAGVGLSTRRGDDFTLAVNEVACNALSHTEHPALVSRVRGGDAGWLVIEVATQGCISDPLIGRELRPTSTGGRGLWLVNQLCDLVESRSGSWGSLTRLHMALP